MNISKKTKTDPSVLVSLNSGKEELVLQTIDILHDSGNPLYIPYLTNLLADTGFETVRESIFVLLGELKNKESVPYLVEAIRNKDLAPFRKQLVASCWQNGLDFSAHLLFFTDLVISEPWEIGFEAFTVIENLENLPEREIIEAAVSKIKMALPASQEKKEYLLNGLLTVLR